MNVRCPACGEAVALAVGDTRLACATCGLATPVSRVGTEPGVALVTLESDLTGTTLAGRQILERIGAGGMGTVYRAKGEAGDVAIKVLRPGLGTDRPAVLARFAREAEALRRLEHPRVVRFLDHGEDQGIAYIITELVEGRDLSATLAAKRLSLTEIVETFGQVCDGVAAAHAAGIVHRDLKPANILVGTTGGVKVADFGLAQLGPGTAITTLTRTDVAMGTFHYLAPEQRKDARAVDHRADIWALGVIFYEMLTGELPLGSFAPPSTKGPAGCDRRTDAIVHRALAPDPAERFATVAELGTAVRALTARPRASRRWIALAAGIVLAGGTAGAVAMTAGGDDRTTTATSTGSSPGSASDDRAAIAASGVAPGTESIEAVPETIVAPGAIDLWAGTAASSGGGIDAGTGTVASSGGATIDAGTETVAPVDAPVVAAAGSGAPRVSPALPVKTTGRTVAKPTKINGGKGKTPDVETTSKPKAVPLAVCSAARRCCIAVKGPGCGAYLASDATTCETALADLRTRATNPKQLAQCR